jgi:DNA-binding NtrC family response regulator
MATILIVDDDMSIVESFQSLFEETHTILTAYNQAEASQLVKENRIDLVFLDYQLPGENGLEVLKKIKALEPELYVIVITGHGSPETIIQTMSLGAYDYLEKPLDIEKITILTNRALESKKIKNFVNVVIDEQVSHYSLKRIIGKSEVMQNVFKTIGLLINNDVSVLINGESGTGKELIAKSLHYVGRHKHEPFIAVNCSGLTEGLLDNELFGHEPQAYTGAYSKKIGKFEAAGEGTFFLDEIGDMPLAIQAKLLRVLQEKEFQRLGGIRTIPLKARIIVATNKDLLKEVQRRLFRQDLYYRINVAVVEVPSLREKKEDIPDLINHFITEANKKLRKTIIGISQEALELLGAYNWPGNVRELENVITIMCINTQTSILQPETLPGYIIKGSSITNMYGAFIDSFLEKHDRQNDLLKILNLELEAELIKKVGGKLKNNKSAMSRVLGISRVTLQKKMSQAGEQ